MKHKELEAEIFILDMIIAWMDSKPLVKLLYKKQLKKFISYRGEKTNQMIVELEKYYN